VLAREHCCADLLQEQVGTIADTPLFAKRHSHKLSPASAECVSASSSGQEMR
jgi:hypothetical protein